MSKEVDVELIFEGEKTNFKADLEEKVIDLKNKFFNKKGMQNKSVIILRNGKLVKEDSKLKDLVSQNDPNKFIFSLFESEKEPEINMEILGKGKNIESVAVEVNFNLGGDTGTIKADTVEVFSIIKKKFLKEINKQDLETYSVYCGNIVDESQILKKIITPDDLNSRAMQVLVYELGEE